MTKVLVIDDNPNDVALFMGLLEKEGYVVEGASDAATGLDRAQSGDFDVVLTDLHLGGPMPQEGHEVVAKLHADNPHLPVIVMTGAHTAEVAIDAIKLGAFDYFAKPINVFDDAFRTDLAAMIDTAANSKRLMSRVEFPGAARSTKAIGDQMVGKSRAMLNVYKEIGRIAPTPATVLIRGETGTGKELVARALWSHSQRENQPFVVVNCAAIPENLLETELFGHEAGAFTGAKGRRLGRFELAHGGTIFLDEIGDMDLKLQQKLLRVLQEGTIERVGGAHPTPIPMDVRVLAATHRDLEAAIKAGEFRQDLYFRLNIAVITLPALRERKEDIPELVNYFIDRYGPELGADPSVAKSASDKLDEAIRFLEEQPWPGNVRELRSVVRKALIVAHGYALTEPIVRRALAQTKPPAVTAQQPFANYVSEALESARRGERVAVLPELMDAVERELYSQAIRRAGGDQGKVVSWLGVSRPTLREKLLKFGFHPRPAKT
jgi:DNA-binding NtrC family response regulator